MTADNRYPPGTTALAALAGAIAWTFPYLIKPFLYFVFPFLPDLPAYHPEPYRIDLAELTISYALAGVIAGAVFLIGLRLFPVDPQRDSRPVLSLRTVLLTLVGMAVGGAAASLFAYGAGFSPQARGLMFFLDVDPLDNRGPEPFLSAGLIIGVALASTIIVSLSGILNQFASQRNCTARIALPLVLRLSLIALATRFVVSSIAFWSFFTYDPVGQSVLFYLMIPIVSGAIFGTWGWNTVSRLRPGAPASAPPPPVPAA